MTTRAAVLLGVLAILAASYALPVRAWLDQRSQMAQLSSERDALAAEVDALSNAVALWDDPAYVRAQARERLNFVLPGEVGLVVLGTESTPAEQPATGAVLPASEADQPWWSTLVAAFSEVGAADGQTQTELESEPQTDPQTDPQDEPAPDDGP
jgi:outer membrane murein-binding lipoprotein Lpp